MILCRVLIPILVIACLAFQASSQGYAGTIITGTGIEPPLTVGSGAIKNTSAGSAAAIGSAVTVGSAAATGSAAAIGSAIAMGSASATGPTAETAVGSAASQADLTGAWSIELSDSKPRHLELNMQQSGNALTGYGNITADDGSRGVTASGSKSGSEIDLSVSVADGSEMYRLELTQSGTSVTGGYNAQSTDGSVWSGTAAGSVGLPASGRNSPVMLGMDLSQLQTADVRNSSITSESSQGATSSGSDHSIRSRSFSSTYSQGQVSTSDVSAGTNYS